MRFLTSILPFIKEWSHSHIDSVLNCQSINSNSIPYLYEYMESTNVDVWTHSPSANTNVTLRVKNPMHTAFVLKYFNCYTIIENVNEWLREEKNEQTLFMSSFHSQQQQENNKQFSNNVLEKDFFKNYQRLDTIVSQLHSWQDQFPLLIRVNDSIGKSIEGRDIPMIHITNFNHEGPKKAIWFNGGQHAREWISSATVLYLAHKFLNLVHDPIVSSYLNKTEIYITPVMNVDGYEYTHTTDRLWRKNRRRNWDGSHGVDLNRNWDEHWGKVGTSRFPPSETYRGSFAFSEPETKAVSDWILTIPNRYAGIDFHSFGQLILRNWGWTKDASQNEKILSKLGDGMKNEIIKTFGHRYTSETGADLYPAAGATDDWMTTKANMIGFTIELRPDGSDKLGFKLPPSEIIPTGEEIWNSILFYIEFILSHDIPPNQ